MDNEILNQILNYIAYGYLAFLFFGIPLICIACSSFNSYIAVRGPRLNFFGRCFYWKQPALGALTDEQVGVLKSTPVRRDRLIFRASLLLDNHLMFLDKDFKRFMIVVFFGWLLYCLKPFFPAPPHNPENNCSM